MSLHDVIASEIEYYSDFNKLSVQLSLFFKNRKQLRTLRENAAKAYRNGDHDEDLLKLIDTIDKLSNAYCAESLTTDSDRIVKSIAHSPSSRAGTRSAS